MKEILMVPTEEWQTLQEHYKGTVAKNAILDKVGTLGATEHAILNEKSIPDSMAVLMTKPLASQRRNLTKRLRTGISGTSSSYGTTQDEPEAMVDAPTEALLKRILKGATTPAPVAPPRAIKQEPSTSGVKRRIKPAVPTTIKKKVVSKKSGVKKAVLKGAAKGALKSFGINVPAESDDDIDLDGSYLGPKAKKKAKGKKPKKIKPTEAVRPTSTSRSDRL